MLNKSKGNMYGFITHTWNPVKGECYHDCSYCYMKRWGKLNPVRLDEKEFKTDLGNGNFIFVGSSTDIFAKNTDQTWIIKVQDYCKKFDNTYLFQTKNPERFINPASLDFFPEKTILCLTLETNRNYPEIMKNSPAIAERVTSFEKIERWSNKKYRRFVTIEPIIKFDLQQFVEFIKRCKPEQVSIGSDSGKHGLPEPSESELKELIYELDKINIKVFLKDNLKRLLASTDAGYVEVARMP